MEDVLLPQSWALDQVISDLHQHGFAVIDRAYEQAYLHDLVEECTENINRFREAAVQNGVVTQIRSDHILWINENLPIAQQHINTLQQLAITLNRAFFTSIREVEAHFACYNAGEFYTLHRDNPQQKMIGFFLPFTTYMNNGRVTGVGSCAYRMYIRIGILLNPHPID